MIKNIERIYIVLLGTLFSLEGYSFFFDIDMTFYYVIPCFVLLVVSTIMFAGSYLHFLKFLILTSIINSLFLTILDYNLHFYKEFNVYLAPILGFLLIATLLLFFLLVYKKSMKRNAIDYIGRINFYQAFMMFFKITTTILLVKLFDLFFVAKSLMLMELERFADIFWVLWTYMLLPALTANLLFFASLKVVRKHGGWH